MTPSKFKFSNPVLTQLEFTVNSDFTRDIEDKMAEMPIDSSISIERSVNDPEAIVSYKIMIAEKTSSYPFYISVTMEAIFRWNDELSNDSVDKMLNYNAPALLLGYIRPCVAQITSASPYAPLHIPFINFLEKNNK